MEHIGKIRKGLKIIKFAIGSEYAVDKQAEIDSKKSKLYLENLKKKTDAYEHTVDYLDERG